MSVVESDQEQSVAELRKLHAETAKLEAEAEKLDAEAKKLDMEARRFRHGAATDFVKLALAVFAAGVAALQVANNLGWL